MNAKPLDDVEVSRSLQISSMATMLDNQIIDEEVLKEQKCDSPEKDAMDQTCKQR